MVFSCIFSRSHALRGSGYLSADTYHCQSYHAFLCGALERGKRDRVKQNHEFPRGAWELGRGFGAWERGNHAFPRRAWERGNMRKKNNSYPTRLFKIRFKTPNYKQNDNTTLKEKS